MLLHVRVSITDYFMVVSMSSYEEKMATFDRLPAVS